MAQSQLIADASILHSTHDGIHTVTLARTGCEEWFLTAPLQVGELPAAMFARVAEWLRGRDLSIVSMEIAGATIESALGSLTNVFGTPQWPISWISSTDSSATGGIQIWAVSGPALMPVEQYGVLAGIAFEDPCATFCRIGGLLPSNVDFRSDEQAMSVLNAMEAALQAANLKFSDVLRTWFYNRDITAWYGEFNRVRNQFFDSRGVFQARVPASTGVGRGSGGVAALTAGLLAIHPKLDSVRIEVVPSPLQCSATNYGSAFSRAIEVAFPDHARLFVSGTASISPKGQTEHFGDFQGQVDRTFDVVDAILRSRDVAWQDVTSGLAYVKACEDIGALQTYLKRNHLDELPILIVHADICRDDLMFELEVNAVSTRVPQESISH